MVAESKKSGGYPIPDGPREGPVFVCRSSGHELQWASSMISKSPVLARLAEGALQGTRECSQGSTGATASVAAAPGEDARDALRASAPGTLRVTTDEQGRVVLDDEQFGQEALAALLRYCQGLDSDFRSLSVDQQVDACRCADFYGAGLSYRHRASAALLDTLDGVTPQDTVIDFTMVPLALGPLVQSVSISNATVQNLNLARCHIVTATFSNCTIEDCVFDASLTTTSLSIAGSRLVRCQFASHCAEASFTESLLHGCHIRGGKEVKIEGCTLTDVQLNRDSNDCLEWTLEVINSKLMTSMEIPASNTVLCSVIFSRGCRLIGGSDVKLKSCVLSDIQFSSGNTEMPCKLEISDSTVATPIELPARASILLDDVVFNDGAWFKCVSARVTRWQQVRIEGPVRLDDVTFNDRVEGTTFSPGSSFEGCNFEFGMGNVAAVECVFHNCKMDSAMKNYHLAQCNFVGSEFDNCAFLPNYPSRGTTLYEPKEASNMSSAKFRQCSLMGRTTYFKFTDPQLSAAWNLHDAQIL